MRPLLTDCKSNRLFCIEQVGFQKLSSGLMPNAGSLEIQFAFPGYLQVSFWVLFSATWGDNKRKSFLDTSSICGEVVHFQFKIPSLVYPLICSCFSRSVHANPSGKISGRWLLGNYGMRSKGKQQSFDPNRLNDNEVYSFYYTSLSSPATGITTFPNPLCSSVFLYAVCAS